MRSKPAAQERKRDPYPHRLYLIFTGLALVSAIGLDYRTARRGEKAYLFPSRTVRQEAAVAPVPLAEEMRRFLAAAGVPSPWSEAAEPEDGSPRIVVRLPREDYAPLERRLERELRSRGASVKKAKGLEADLAAYSWRITGSKEERLTLVFALLEPKPEAPSPPAGGRVAIIIDDMGTSLEALKEVGDLRRPITVSILPQSLYAEEAARLAHQDGLEVMMHLPGESLNHEEGNSQTAGLIRSGMAENDVVALVEEGLSRVPYAEGVNNHMGSKITREEAVMRPILDLIKSRGLYFVDSRTTAESIAFDLAERMGLRAAYRNVFLDSTVGTEFSKQKIIELFRLARREGAAVAIGHPFPETLQALRECLPLINNYGVTLVFASEIVTK